MLGGESDPQGIVQEVWIWPYQKMIYAQPRIHPGEWDSQTSLGSWDTNRSSNIGLLTGSSDNQQKRTCWIVDFAVPAQHWVKLKENWKRDKYLNLARELKKMIRHEGDGDTSCNCCAQNNPQNIDKGTGGLGNKRISGDHPNDITTIENNAEYWE